MVSQKQSDSAPLLIFSNLQKGENVMSKVPTPLNAEDWAAIFKERAKRENKRLDEILKEADRKFESTIAALDKLQNRDR